MVCGCAQKQSSASRESSAQTASQILTQSSSCIQTSMASYGVRVQDLNDERPESRVRVSDGARHADGEIDTDTERAGGVIAAQHANPRYLAAQGFREGSPAWRSGQLLRRAHSGKTGYTVVNSINRRAGGRVPKNHNSMLR